MSRNKKLLFVVFLKWEKIEFISKVIRFGNNKRINGYKTPLFT